MPSPARINAIRDFLEWCDQPYVDVFNITPDRANEIANEYFTEVRGIPDDTALRIIDRMKESIEEDSDHGRIREWKRCCIGVAGYLLGGQLDGPHRTAAAGATVRLSGWANTCMGFYAAFKPPACDVSLAIWGRVVPYLKIGEEYSPDDIRIDETLLDEDGYMSLWDFAEGKQTEKIGSPKKDKETRTFASRVLNFICENNYEVEISPEHQQEIRRGFSPDNNRHILLRWSVGSKFVDAVASRIRVPPYDLLDFLKEKRFDPDVTYNPDAPTRLAWFRRWKIKGPPVS
jgi:hypothetical protein